MFTLMPLPFDFDALEPHIHAQTLQFHYAKHHAGYVNKLNELLADFPEFLAMTLEELLANYKKLPENIQTAVFNNAGQVYNHNLYWQSLAPANGNSKPTGTLADKITETFGDFQTFQKQFSDLGVSQFGSGWIWLSFDSDGKLTLDKTPNAESPLIMGKTPLMVMDVWEHAYYLDYQNLRVKYIESFWNVVNWAEIGRKFEALNSQNKSNSQNFI